MVEPTLEFLGRNLQMIQLDQRRMKNELDSLRGELRAIDNKLDVLSDKFDLLMDAFGSLEAAVKERLGG